MEEATGSNPVSSTRVFAAQRRPVVGQAAQLPDIEGISVSSQCHGLVALDKSLTVIRPAKLWNNTTCARQTSRLRGFGIDWPERVGVIPNAAHPTSKLAWLKEVEADASAQMCHEVLPHDYVNMRLAGRRPTDLD